MKNYAVNMGREVAGEVRGQWVGSSGSIGALRLGREIESAVAANPALTAAWQRELARARQALVKQAARAMRNEAAAAGQVLSTTAARGMAATRVTQEAMEEYARRTAGGRFMSRVLDTHQRVIRPQVTGFDPQQNWLGQLPRMYASGARAMWADLQGKGAALNAAYRTGGGVAGAASVAGGWMSEEVFKTFVGGTAKSYKEDENAALPNASHAQAGANKVRDDAGKNLFTAITGAPPEAMGGRLMLGTPYDRFVKAQVSNVGANASTVSNELGFEEPEQNKDVSNAEQEADGE